MQVIQPVNGAGHMDLNHCRAHIEATDFRTFAEVIGGIIPVVFPMTNLAACWRRHFAPKKSVAFAPPALTSSACRWDTLELG